MMAIRTLGQLLDWLLDAPRTRLEILRATRATPDDLAAALSLLSLTMHIQRQPRIPGQTIRVRPLARTLGSAWVLNCSIAGCRQHCPDRDLHHVRPWVEVVVPESAREWKLKADASLDETTGAVRAEEFLAVRLGRRASDQEVSLFWNLVDSPEGEPGRPACWEHHPRFGWRRSIG